MNTIVSKNIRLNDQIIQHSTDHISPKSNKRIKLDASNSPIINEFEGKRKWSCRGDVSFVEPEVLVDLGVSMLDDDTSCDGIIKLRSEISDISPKENSKHSQQLSSSEELNLNEKSISRESTFEAFGFDRSDEDNHHKESLAIFGITNNESGYASRVESDRFIDKQNLSRSDSSLLDSSDTDQFYLYRRKRRPSLVGDNKFNKLSDEIILMILKWLPKKWLVQSMLVCKRWCEIARDEALWSRLDLGSKVLNSGTLGHVIPRGVQILRLAQAEIADPIFLPETDILTDCYTCKLQYLDLSMAVLSPHSLSILLSKCKLLKKLSLERSNLNDECCKAISENINISVLNLTMCEGISRNGLKYLTKLNNLNALNISWSSLDSDSVSLLCKLLPHSVTRLNIAGCRKTITDDGVKVLINSCPNLVELDLSDCTLLTINSIQCILTLKKLEHLSLSRCYSVPPSTYMRLVYMPSLMFLDIFGLMAEPTLKSLQANSKGTEINKFLFSSVARPTVGVRRTSIWGLRVRD